MKIGIIGASGKAGSTIMKEAIERGHEVTPIVRDANKIQNKQVAIIEKSIFDLTQADIKEFDVIVNAFKADFGQEHQHVEAGKVLIEAIKGVNTRLIVVGGAGSLFVDEAKTLRNFDGPNFPEAYLATAKNMGKNLEDLQNTSDIYWTYLSPASFFDPEGKRTGTYQKNEDYVILNSNGESYVSYFDYAIALLDEIEKPQHINKRFTVIGER